MPGPMPAQPGSGKRSRNRTGAAVLRAVPDAVVPDLPDDRPWHALTRAWWNAVWTSAMASELGQVEFYELLRVGMLVDLFHTAMMDGDARLAVQLEAEIRIQGQRFGLSPLDRRRLQWTIEQGEAAEEKTAARRVKKAARRPRKAADPRALLA